MQNLQVRCFLDETPRFVLFLDGTFQSFVRNSKRFCEEDSESVSRWRTFLGSVEFFYCFFWHFNSFGSFLHLPNLFWWVSKKSNFFYSVVFQWKKTLDVLTKLPFFHYFRYFKSFEMYLLEASRKTASKEYILKCLRC